MVGTYEYIGLRNSNALAVFYLSLREMQEHSIIEKSKRKRKVRSKAYRWYI